ncbi:hypothetical protein C6P46_003342 [Rhodotorula mucilaginosa]|uniref:Uncharacterized protein n=1 Tax=Rhodotorula mucilaginosa TaxID=5537 RepID=A0A9P6W4L9_RHOMI|nr:hypothetical protein C6P46_003342 [Rhodotorula mucilaginosa]
MLRVQRVLANGEQTEGTIAYFEEPGSPRSYESIREELRTVYGQRVELSVLHDDGAELDLYPSVWSILVRPGTTIIVKAATGLGTALSGRGTPRLVPTPREQTDAVSDAYTIAQRLEALAELAAEAPRRHSPLASQRDRNRQASSAPESPRLEPSVYPSPPTSRPRSLVGPSAATSALASLATSCPDLGQRHASVSPPTTRKQTASLTMTSRWGGEEERGDSTSPRSASALAESVKGVRRTSAGMPHLASHHFDDIGEWDGGVGTAVTSVMRPKEAPAASGAFSRGTKPKRPTLDTVAGPSSPRHSSSISPSQAMIKASSAPVTATEMQEESEIPRRIRTQADLRTLAATRPRPRPTFGTPSASFPPAPPLTTLAARRSPSSPHPASFSRKSSMGVLSTALPRPEQLRLTTLETRPVTAEQDLPFTLEMPRRSPSPLGTPFSYPTSTGPVREGRYQAVLSPDTRRRTQ